MSPMLDIQRRHADVFRLRLGEKGSRGEPKKLTDAIRVTSANENIVAAFTAVYGGQVRPWEAQFEAYLPTTELPVLVLPGQSLSQWWETYRGTVCERRCDGEVESLSGGPCQCPRDIVVRMQTKGACRPMTRINIACPEVAVVGAGSLVSHGMIAAETLPQAFAVAQGFLERGIMVPAVLRIIEHKGKRHYVVPQLEIVGVSLGGLNAAEQEPLPMIEPAPKAQLSAARAALSSGEGRTDSLTADGPPPAPPPNVDAETGEVAPKTTNGQPFTDDEILARTGSNPYARAVHIHATKLKVDAETLAAVIKAVTGDPSANSVNRDNRQAVLDAITAAAPF